MKVKTLINQLEKAIGKNPAVANYLIAIQPNSTGGPATGILIDHDRSNDFGDWRDRPSVSIIDF